MKIEGKGKKTRVNETRWVHLQYFDKRLEQALCRVKIIQRNTNASPQRKTKIKNGGNATRHAYW